MSVQHRLKYGLSPLVKRKNRSNSDTNSSYQQQKTIVNVVNDNNTKLFNNQLRRCTISVHFIDNLLSHHYISNDLLFNGLTKNNQKTNKKQKNK
jgi:hypothetical protein